MEKTIKDFINGKVTYDKYGQYFWIKTPNEGDQMLGELRGWGRIQYMFKTEKDAEIFHDEVGQFIADAINEKIGKL